MVENRHPALEAEAELHRMEVAVGEESVVAGQLVDNIDNTQHSFGIRRRLHTGRLRSIGHTVHYNPQRLESQRQLQPGEVGCQRRVPVENAQVVGIAGTGASNLVGVVDIDDDVRCNRLHGHCHCDDDRLGIRTHHNSVAAGFL